jgi:hypothetical protein
LASEAGRIGHGDDFQANSKYVVLVNGGHQRRDVALERVIAGKT